MVTLIIILVVFGLILYLYYRTPNKKRTNIPPLSEQERERQRGLVDPEIDGYDTDVDKVEPRHIEEPIVSFIERELEPKTEMNKDIQKKIDNIVSVIETVTDEVKDVAKQITKPKRTYKKKK